jgi:enoyl-CoA hydratase/carnithine racemase
MLDQSDHGATRVLALAREAQLNAFNGPLFDALVEGLQGAAEDDTVSVVVITGKGRAFTAGADLTELGQRTAPPKHGFAGLVDCLIDYPKPVIAAVNGVAVGVGGTICGLVDMVFMAESARMRCPFAALGINPEAGSSLAFQQLMGPQRAAWFLYSAETLNAAEAKTAGLALDVLPDEGFLDAVLARADVLARQAPNSLRETKALMMAPKKAALREIVALENEALTRTVGSPENREAIAAFMEKRSPDFTAARLKAAQKG